MTDDLSTWLRAQLDEDERKVAAMAREAERVRTAPIFQGYPPNWLAGVDIFVSPKRWQAEIDAKRRLLELHPTDVAGGRPFCHCMAPEGIIYGEWPCAEYRLLALPYADRPGYRDEWRP